MGMTIPARRNHAPHAIGPKRRINDVFTLHELIERARDDIARAQHELQKISAALYQVRLALGTAESTFESIVAIYNRLVLTHDGGER